MPPGTIRLILTVALALLAVRGAAWAGGPFGPPQPTIRAQAGWHTAVGAWLEEDRFRDGAEITLRQNLIYSELGYGSPRGWEVYGRVGLADLRASDAFRPAGGTTTSARNDLQDHGRFFGSLGAKGFIALNPTFGLGLFVQGTCHFSDYGDSVSGSRGGAPFLLEMRLKSLWDISGGMGLQAALPGGILLYGGSYVRHAEARIGPSSAVAGMPFAAETTLDNRGRFGGYAGLAIPLSRGFRLEVEGRGSERISAGAAITYTY
jgi:hypothetical protein